MSVPDVPVAVRSGPQLSETQRSLLASHLRYPESAVQTMPLLSHFDGPIDSERLAAAFHTVVEASDVMRTVVRPDAEQADSAVAVARQLPATTEFCDVPREQVYEWARKRLQHPLDLRVAGYDSAIARHEDGTCTWFLGLHHCTTDATGSTLALDATAALYNGGSLSDSTAEDDTENAIVVSSFYEWTKALPPKPVAKSERQSAARISSLYGQPETIGQGLQRIPLELSEAAVAEIEDRLTSDYRSFSRPLGVSVLAITATALYLHRLSGSTEFSIGMPVHNRDPKTSQLTGPTITIVPVDVIIDPSDTHKSLHAKIGKSVAAAMGRAKEALPAADYDAVVNVIPNHHLRTLGSVNWRTERLAPAAMDPDQFLRVQATPNADGGLAIALDVGDRIGDLADVAVVGDHFRAVLSGLVSDPESPIGDVDICADTDTAALISWGTAPELAPARESVVARLKNTLATNDEIVLRDRDQTISGRDLWRWTNAIATELRSNHGAGVRVGVELGPSIQAVAAIYGILQARCSFVPLDPTQPLDRRDRLAARASLAKRFADPGVIDALRPAAHTPSDDDSSPTLDEEPEPDAEAYLMFTSGSTGEPKGVPITNDGLARYLAFAHDNYFEAEGAPVAPLFGSLGFDLTLTSLFAPILAGGTLVVIEEQGPAALAQIAQLATPVTWCKATPSHLEILVGLLPSDHQLNTLVVGGEAFRSSLARRLLGSNPDFAIFNEYGPTEAVVGCMTHRTTTDDLTKTDVPIGRPAPGVTLRIVDRYGQRMPVGATGELWVAHAGLTAGYLTDPNSDVQDDDAFVDVDGVRFYRTRDLVRLDGDQLIYVGRTDEQMKVGGVRLDPSEIERALDAHPAIRRSIVRQWSPRASTPRHRCVDCGLPDNVPSVEFDANGVCNTCLTYHEIAPIVTSWFKTTNDLVAKLHGARQRVSDAGKSTKYDCLHLLSGGKDSTYALYQLVELGFHPYVMTLDNGFISEGALSNARRAVEHLGLDYEVATTDVMDGIFRDSLQTHSNVCNGCFKTIYTLAGSRAAELSIPMIVTGLSRGQLFETRLTPDQFRAEQFDPDAIDRAVTQARKLYHRADDYTNRTLDASVFATDDYFDNVEYIDFYRYIDVELSEMIDYLENQTRWSRPVDTGRSTNCLINVAGIHTHLIQQGYHNYAEPYAWDVRLGHKTRAEAIAELEDEMDLAEVQDLLGQIGYTPRVPSLLTAWIDTEGQAPSPAELREFVAGVLPAYAVPAAFVAGELPITPNGKVDESALRAPLRRHRSPGALSMRPTTDLESTIVGLYEQQLGIEPVGVTDDFFGLGGDSLAALQMITELGIMLGARVREELAFVHTTAQDLASAIESLLDAEPTDAHAAEVIVESAPVATRDPATPPALSDGEMSILFEQRARPNDTMYNPVQIFIVDGDVARAPFEQALRAVARNHETLTWGYGQQRRLLTSDQAVAMSFVDHPIADGDLQAAFQDLHLQVYDLENGPLLRCRMQPLVDGRTAIGLGMHHVSCDRESFAVLWNQIDDALNAGTSQVPAVGYSDFSQWQKERSDQHRAFWSDYLHDVAPNPLRCEVVEGEPDGVARRRTSLSSAELRAHPKSTPATLAVAAVMAAARPYVEHDDTTLGLIVSTRTHPVADDLVGYLLNPMPLQLHCEASTTLDELSDQASTHVGRSLAHREYPLASIVADQRAAGRTPPSPELLVVLDDWQPMSLEGALVERVLGARSDAVAGLSFFLRSSDDTVEVMLEYSAGLVTANTADELLERFEAALVALLRSPSVTVDQLHRSRPSLSKLIGPDLVDAPDTLLPALLANVHTNPDDPAVACGDRTLSWVQLVERSEAIARRLVESGVKPGDSVLMCLPQTPELVASILGILRANAVYVPVDPEFPQDRIATIVSEANAQVAIVSAETLTTAPAGVARLVIAESGVDGQPWAAVSPSELLPGEPAGDDTAYLIFTSGSTGTPSGVVITHRNLAASTWARTEVYDSSPSRFALLSSVSFDSSIVGIFWTLLHGGAIVLAPEHQRHDIDTTVAMLATPGVSHTLCVPTLYQALLARRDRTVGATSWPAHVIVAGEALPVSLVRAHFAGAQTSRLTNEYGPTEASVWATVQHINDPEQPVTIGVPIPGAWVAIVKDQAICPATVRGELVIGGAGVAAGYQNDPAGTERRFVTQSNDDQLPAPYFRTGDLASIVDGQVVFHGRIDDQLSIAGLRIEPQEIEHAIEGELGVTAAIATVVDTRSLADLLEATPTELINTAIVASTRRPGNEAEALEEQLRQHGTADVRLVAHIEGPLDLDQVALRSVVAQKLPANRRPSMYVVHDELPRTPTGKTDRRAAARLPVTTAGEPAGTEVTTEPSDGAQGLNDVDGIAKDLTSHFASVLRRSDIAPADSFFDCGGDSLLVLELLHVIETSMGIFLPTTALYETPSPAALAQAIVDLGLQPTAAAANDDNVRSLIFPLQTTGTRTPCVALQSIGPDASFYRPIAQALGPDQPFYAMADPHKRHRSGTKRSIELLPPDVEQMAATYVRAIEHVVPLGPVNVVGGCHASIVAYEVAQQLTRKGRVVERLVLIDDVNFAPGLRSLPAVTSTQRAWRSFKEVYESGSKAGAVVGRKARTAAAIVQYKVEDRAVVLAEQRNMPLSRRLQVHKYVARVSASISNYSCERYEAPASVIRFGIPEGELELGQCGWGGLLPDVKVWGLPCRTQPQSVSARYVDRMAELFAKAIDPDRAPVEIAPLEVHEVQQRLVEGLHGGGFPNAFDTLRDRVSLSDEAAAALDEVAATVDAMARSAADTSDTVAQALRAHGLQVTVGAQAKVPTQDRAVLFVDDDMTLVDAAMTDVGFERSGGTNSDRYYASAIGGSTRVRITQSMRAASAAPSAEEINDEIDTFLFTPHSLIEPLLSLAELNADELLVDVGCGDAAALIKAVQQFACRGRGIENDVDMAARAQAAVQAAGLQDRIEIICGTAVPTHIADADVAFVFLPAEIANDFIAQAVDVIPAHGRIIAHEQVPIDWQIKPDLVQLVISPPNAKHAALTVAHLWSQNRRSSSGIFSDDTSDS